MSTDDRSELLRTQAVQRCLEALGAAQVTVYGNEPTAGGVVLDSDSQITSRSYWRIGDQRWEYDVVVSIEVKRSKSYG